MIRLAFMTDDSLMIGYDNPEGNAHRFKIIPETLWPQLDKILEGDHYLCGSKSIVFYRDNNYGEGKKLYILSRDPHFTFEGKANTEVTTNYMDLVEKFKDSDEVLVVIGGKIIFELMLPYAKEVDIVYADTIVPGNVKFDAWKSADLSLVNSEKWDGGTTYYYKQEVR